jgi:RNA polymerase sigma factor (sigma-70 family)
MRKHGLFRILKNSFINDFRKKSKQPSKVDYQEVEGYYNSDDVDENITTDLRVETVQDMIGDEVSGALNSLDVDFRTVIILCDLEGFTYEEMAKILDIPIGTVRSRLHRARNLLKEKLKEYANSMGYK